MERGCERHLGKREAKDNIRCRLEGQDIGRGEEERRGREMASSELLFGCSWKSNRTMSLALRQRKREWQLAIPVNRLDHPKFINRDPVAHLAAIPRLV